MADFRGKTVLITGAAGIYGTQFAKSFAAAGAKLFLTDRDAAQLAPLRAGRGGAAVETAPCELTEIASIDALCRTVLERVGCPDVVVSNAGIYPFAGLFDTTVETWDRIMEVNLRAPFRLTQNLARTMIDRGVRGAFIYIGSGAAHILRTNGLAYCTSKRGLEWLAKGMALELAPHGIRANVVEPGLAVGGAGVEFPPGYVEALAARMPMGHLGEPGDAAAAVMFLASDEARYITGHSLAVDGGGSLPRRALPLA